MAWTRRALLRALGASALGPALAPMLAACRPPPSARSPGATAAARPVADLRAQLRQIVSDLSQRYPRASALAVIRHRGAGAVDAGERGLEREVTAALVLSTGPGAQRHEHATRDVSARGVERAARALRERASAGFQATRSPRAVGAPRSHATPVSVDPRPLADARWLARLQALYDRASRVGGSRVVYRGAYVLVDDADVLYMGDGVDLLQRLVRTRTGVVLVAQSREGSAVERAEAAGAAGLELSELSDDAIERAAEAALSLLTPGAAPAGERDVVLSPEVAAWLVGRCVIPALAGDRWVSGESGAAALLGRRVAADAVTLRDDPTLAGGLGSYFFDDEGAPAAPTVTVEAGVLRRPLVDHATADRLGVPPAANGRRDSPFAPVAPRPSNAVLAPGDRSRDDLVADIDDGLLLESPLDARVDLARWRFVVRAARAHEIRRGKLTGVLRGITELSGHVPALLASVRGVGRDPSAVAVHGGGLDARAASAVVAPAVLARGSVAGGSAAEKA